MYEVDSFSETVNIRSLDFKSLTYEEVVTQILQELQKQADFYGLYKEFCTQCILNLNTVRWSPALEYQVIKILRDKDIGTVEAHALLLHTKELQRPLEYWRKKADMSAASLLTNAPCKLREPRETKWKLCDRPSRGGVLVRTLDAVWSFTTADSNVNKATEPEDFAHASVFASIPARNGEEVAMHSASLCQCILALKEKEISVGCLGDSKSFASFAHGINGADFLETYLLPSNTIIVRVGKRNLLTGGLTDEDYFSFVRNGERSIIPHSLNSEETAQVEEISKIDSDSSWDFMSSSCLTGFNDLASAQSKVLWKQQELVLGSSLVVAVLGHPSSFFAVFYDGAVHHYKEGVIFAHSKTKLPITHAILKF
jgi:hypothetical protein